jgi:transposase
MDQGAVSRAQPSVERFFHKLKQFRRIATRYDKLGASYLAFLFRSLEGSVGLSGKPRA